MIISSLGGPFLAIPTVAVGNWGGTTASDFFGDADEDDYEYLCGEIPEEFSIRSGESGVPYFLIYSVTTALEIVDWGSKVLICPTFANDKGTSLAVKLADGLENQELLGSNELPDLLAEFVLFDAVFTAADLNKENSVTVAVPNGGEGKIEAYRTEFDGLRVNFWLVC